MLFGKSLEKGITLKTRINNFSDKGADKHGHI